MKKYVLSLWLKNDRADFLR